MNIITLITFPGVILHELSHYVACCLSKIKVREACLLCFSGDTVGYVVHDPTNSPTKSCLVGISPFVLNTFAAMIMFYISKIQNLNEYVFYFIIWLGVSFSMHSPPSRQDLHNTWDVLVTLGKTRKSYINTFKLVIISIPILSILVVGYIITILQELFGIYVGIFYSMFLYGVI